MKIVLRHYEEHIRTKKRYIFHICIFSKWWLYSSDPSLPGGWLKSPRLRGDMGHFTSITFFFFFQWKRTFRFLIFCLTIKEWIKYNLKPFPTVKVILKWNGSKNTKKWPKSPEKENKTKVLKALTLLKEMHFVSTKDN